MSKRSRSSLVLILGIALITFVPGTAQPQADGPGLVDRLRARVAEAELGDALGICVRDAKSGREIFSHHKKLPLNPASNMKLVTAAAALRELGGDYRMRTGLYGAIDEQGRVPELVLRGYGDPTLRLSDLMELARQLGDKGVTRVERLVVDGGYFDDRFLPPAFDQQPAEDAAFRAPVAAVAVERSSYTLRVLPGAEPGDAARVRLAAEDYFDLANEMTTSESGPPDVIAIQKARDQTMKLTLRGTVPAGVLGVSYRRRVERPLPYAGHAMADALGRHGIVFGGTVDIGEGADGLALLASRNSRPLAQILFELGKHSDNFVAEMLLKVLGAERKRPGRSERGLKALAATLKAAGVDTGRVQLVNGSGLFDGNELPADALAKLLVHMYGEPSLRPEFLAPLAVGGVDGTLHRRLEDLPAERIVRAKTGTLAGVIALSGYVLGPEPDQAMAFAVLANDVRGKHHAARQLADDLVAELAGYYYQ